MQQVIYAPGARVVIRDCEWIVRRADRSDDGGYILTVDGLLTLAADKAKHGEGIRRSRRDENAWPKLHYLWPQCSATQWLEDKLMVLVARHNAPVLPDTPQDDAALQQVIPNSKAHPITLDKLEALRGLLVATTLALGLTRKVRNNDLADDTPYAVAAPDHNAQGITLDWVGIQHHDPWQGKHNSHGQHHARRTNRTHHRVPSPLLQTGPGRGLSGGVGNFQYIRKGVMCA